MVNFICQCDWPKSRLLVNIFSGVSERVFPNMVSIWNSRLRKEHWPHQCQWASINLLGAQIEPKVEEGQIYSTSAGHPYSPTLRTTLRYWHPVLEHSNWDWDLCSWQPCPNYWTFRLRVNYTTSFPAPLARRWQMVVLLGLHIYVSKLS